MPDTTIDDLIKRNAQPVPDDSATTPAAEPSGGLLSRIGDFIGGSSKADTLDASGLTQADRRQSLFAGLSDIGSKLMAAGEPMWGPDRAKILASMGNVPANMAQMRSSIAQQKLLGLKSAQALREMQVQKEMDAVAKDPNHPMWATFSPQDKALAQWSMRTGGPKAFMEFMAHKNDAQYKEDLAAKVRAETQALTNADTITRQLVLGGGGPAPASGGGAPASGGGAPPVVPTPAPTAPAYGGSVSPEGTGPAAATAGTGGDAGGTLTPAQQALLAGQPPAVSPDTRSVVPPPAPSQGDALPATTDSGTPIDPNTPAPAFMGGPQVAQAAPQGPIGGDAGAAAVLARPLPPTATAPAVPPSTAPAQTSGGITLPPGYGVPRTIDEVAQHLSQAQKIQLMSLPPLKRAEELAKYVSPDTKAVYHVPTGKMIFVNKNAPPHPDFAPPEQATQIMREKEFAQKAAQDAITVKPDGTTEINQAKAQQLRAQAVMEDAVKGGPEQRTQTLQRLVHDLAKDGYVIDPETQAVTFNQELAKRNQDQAVSLKTAEALGQAQAQQVDRQRAAEEERNRIAAGQAAVGAAEKGRTTAGEIDPQKQAENQAEAAQKAQLELSTGLAKTVYTEYTGEKGAQAKAIGAANTLRMVYDAKDFLGKGMLAGSAPETRMAIARARDTLGLGKLSEDELNRTSFDQLMGRTVLESLGAGRPLGSQVSDRDVQFMNSLAGRDSYTAPELKRILSIAENASLTAIQNNKDAVARMKTNHPQLIPHLKDSEISVPDEAAHRAERRQQAADEFKRQQEQNATQPGSGRY